MNKFLQKQKEKIIDFFFEEVEVVDDTTPSTETPSEAQQISKPDDGKQSKILNVRRTDNGFVFDVLEDGGDMVQGVFLSKDKIYDAENLRIRKMLKKERRHKLSIMEDLVIFPIALILLVYLLNILIDFILKVRGM